MVYFNQIQNSPESSLERPKPSTLNPKPQLFRAFSLRENYPPPPTPPTHAHTHAQRWCVCVVGGATADRDSTKITNQETECHVSTWVAKHVLSAAPAPGVEGGGRNPSFFMKTGFSTFSPPFFDLKKKTLCARGRRRRFIQRYYRSQPSKIKNKK
jgi:hypothetical protein